jgi:hypothetical protein
LISIVFEGMIFSIKLSELVDSMIGFSLNSFVITQLKCKVTFLISPSLIGPWKFPQ